MMLQQRTLGAWCCQFAGGGADSFEIGMKGLLLGSSVIGECAHEVGRGRWRSTIDARTPKRAGLVSCGLLFRR